MDYFYAFNIPKLTCTIYQEKKISKTKPHNTAATTKHNLYCRLTRKRGDISRKKKQLFSCKEVASPSYCIQNSKYFNFDRFLSIVVKLPLYDM